jgi:uncharacterized protein
LKNAILGALLFISLFFIEASAQSAITLGNETFSAEIADTQELREHGLSGRATLKPNSAMLFTYTAPGNYKFWMKDTLFPLDILWISADKKIVFMEKNISPKSYPQTFGPSSEPPEAQYVIEVAAGTADRLKLQIGDKVVFKLPPNIDAGL